MLAIVNAFTRSAPWIDSGVSESDVMTAEHARKIAAAWLNAADVMGTGRSEPISV